MLLLTSTFVVGQSIRLPEAVTNQAAVILARDGSLLLYTFYGLDSTLHQPGVHRKVFRVDMGTGEERHIGVVPDSAGRLASSATVIRGKAYLCGGYSVHPSGKEKSSSLLLQFDPETESFRRGKDLPVPIDDQVQAAWRDSLLFVVSGWNDSNNVRAVQVYDPVKDAWSLATPLPDEKDAAVFGGCGTIVGDTIYLLGGAVFEKYYPPSRSMYKGWIDPGQPERIRWQKGQPYPGEARYRSAAYHKDGKVHFIGGSNLTYNYNGISYRDKEPVAPNRTELVYDIRTGRFSILPAPFPVMDLRNIVTDGRGRFFVAGGMGAGQRVRDEVSELGK
jgi:hypothetical protein